MVSKIKIKITKGEKLTVKVQPNTDYIVHLVDKNGKVITTNFKPLVELKKNDKDSEDLEAVLEYSTIIVFEGWTQETIITYYPNDDYLILVPEIDGGFGLGSLLPLALLGGLGGGGGSSSGGSGSSENFPTVPIDNEQDTDTVETENTAPELYYDLDYFNYYSDKPKGILDIVWDYTGDIYLSELIKDDEPNIPLTYDVDFKYKSEPHNEDLTTFDVDNNKLVYDGTKYLDGIAVAVSHILITATDTHGASTKVDVTFAYHDRNYLDSLGSDIFPVLGYEVI